MAVTSTNFFDVSQKGVAPLRLCLIHSGRNEAGKIAAERFREHSGKRLSIEIIEGSQTFSHKDYDFVIAFDPDYAIGSHIPPRKFVIACCFEKYFFETLELLRLNKCACAIAIGIDRPANIAKADYVLKVPSVADLEQAQMGGTVNGRTDTFSGWSSLVDEIGLFLSNLQIQFAENDFKTLREYNDNKIHPPGELKSCVPYMLEAAECIAGFRSSAVIGDLRKDPKDIEVDYCSPGSDLLKPQVSIVIPTYNRPGELARALSSVLSQIGPSKEIIVVNDNGVKPDWSFLQSKLSPDTSLTCISHTRNHGLASSRNTGALRARGEWLLFLDDDDLLLPNSLISLFAATSGSSARFFYGNHARKYSWEDETVELRKIDNCSPATLVNENPILCGSFIISSCFFKELGGYREDLRVHEDYNLHLRVFAKDKPVHVDHFTLLYNCEQSKSRMNNSKRPLWFGTSAINHALFRSLFQDTPELRQLQREGQYAHLTQAMTQGVGGGLVRSMIEAWWAVLIRYNLREEIARDLKIIQRIMPDLFGQLAAYRYDPDLLESILKS